MFIFYALAFPDYSFGPGGPDKRFGGPVTFLEKAVNGGLKVNVAAEGTVMQVPSGQLGEQSFYHLQPVR